VHEFSGARCPTPGSAFLASGWPRHEDSVVPQLEQPLRPSGAVNVHDGPSPDVDPLCELSSLPNTRDHDDRHDRLTEQEVVVLCEEEHIGAGESRTDSRVRCPSPPERNDVVGSRRLGEREPIPVGSSRPAGSSRCVTNRWRQMSCHMRGIGECRADLLQAERVLCGDRLSRFAGGQGSHNRRDIDARAAQAWLAEAHIGIHRHTREDVHRSNSSTGRRNRPCLARPGATRAATGSKVRCGLCQNAGTDRRQRLQAVDMEWVTEIGWEAGIRTPISRVRVCCPTVERPPSTAWSPQAEHRK